MKIKQTGETKFTFYCEGCKSHHEIDTKIWTFNGNFEKPTIRASVLVTYPTYHQIEESGLGVKGTEYLHTCHSFVTDGVIEYLGDCTHDLKNTKVELLNVE